VTPTVPLRETHGASSSARSKFSIFYISILTEIDSLLGVQLILILVGDWGSTSPSLYFSTTEETSHGYCIRRKEGDGQG
jgi:hypothetical protein